MAKTTGLRAGTIYASLAVRTEEWAKGMKRALGDLNRFTSQVESAGSKLGGFGAIMAASIGGAVAVASSEIKPLNTALESLKRSGQDFANEIGTQMVPVVESLAAGMRKAADAVASLDPRVKEVAASVAVWTTGGLIAAGMVGKLAGAVAGLSQGLLLVMQYAPKALAMVGLGSAAALAPALAIGAAVAGLVLAAGAVYRAWNDASTGFADAVRGMLAKVGEWVGKVGESFEKVFEAVRGFIRRGIKLMLDQVAALVRGIAKLLQPVAEFFELDGAEEFLSKASKLTGDELLKGMERGAQAIVSGAAKAGRVVLDGAKVAGESIGYGLTYAAGGVKDMFEDFIGKAKSMLFSGSPGGGAGGSAGERPAWWKVYDEIQTQLIQPLRDANLKELQAAFERVTNSMHVLASRALPAITSAFELATVSAQEMAHQAAVAAAKQRMAVADYASGLAQNVVGQLGTAGQVAQGAMQGAAVAGPWGAVAGAAVGLFSETESLQKLLSAIQPILDALIGILDAVLMPIIDALAPVFATIGVVLEALKPAIEGFGFGIELLKPVLEVVANVIAAVVRVIGSVWNGIIDAVSWVVGIFDASAAEWLKAKKMNLGAMDAALARIGQEERIADAAESIADKLTDADHNIPAGWRRNLATYGAMDPHATAPGRGGGNVYIDTVQTLHPGEFADEVDYILEHRRERARRKNTGSRLARGSLYLG